MLKDIDDLSFEKINDGDTIAIDFWAPWCGPCRVMGGLVEELAARYTGIDFYKMNVDDNPITAGKYNIRSIPTLLLLKGGEIIEEIIGLTPVDKISEKIDLALKNGN